MPHFKFFSILWIEIEKKSCLKVMFISYSVNLELDVQIYNYCHSEKKLDKLLDAEAKRFILKNECSHRAENPYRDEVPNEAVPTGYFLRHSEKPHQIDVYLRKIIHTENTVEVSCNRVLYFSAAKAPFKVPHKHTKKHK